MNQKMRTYLITMVILVLLSIGMFVYVNFFSTTSEIKMATIYTANADIIGYTEITPSLFTSKEIPETSVVEGMITNLTSVNGAYAKGPIYKGDILTEASLTKDAGDKDMEYTINFQPTYSGDIAFGDLVDVYQISPANEITLLYGRKRVEKAKTISSEAVTENGNYEAATSLYFKVTKKEMLDYYAKLNSYKFIVLPINTAYTNVEEILPENNGGNGGSGENYAIASTETIAQDGLTAKAYCDMKGINLEAFMDVNPTIANSNDVLQSGTQVNIPKENTKPVVIE